MAQRYNMHTTITAYLLKKHASGRAIDITMMHAINDIGTTAANATTTTKAAVQHFLDYAHCNPDAELIYRASDMILQSDLDAAYLVMPMARS